MVKVKILSSFVDKYTDEVYKVGDTVDFPVERLKELKQNLSVHDREFFEEETKEVKTVENTKEETKEVKTVENTKEEKVEVTSEEKTEEEKVEKTVETTEE